MKFSAILFSFGLLSLGVAAPVSNAALSEERSIEINEDAVNYNVIEKKGTEQLSDKVSYRGGKRDENLAFDIKYTIIDKREPEEDLGFDVNYKIIDKREPEENVAFDVNYKIIDTEDKA